jgi:hypothetical protein
VKNRVAWRTSFVEGKKLGTNPQQKMTFPKRKAEETRVRFQKREATNHLFE